MSVGLLILLSLAIGTAMGMVYFGGLWWTVVRIQHSHSPVTFYLSSFGIRMAMLLAGCFALLHLGIAELAAALLGVFISRFLLIRRLGLETNPEHQQKAGTA